MPQLERHMEGATKFKVAEGKAVQLTTVSDNLWRPMVVGKDWKLN